VIVPQNNQNNHKVALRTPTPTPEREPDKIIRTGATVEKYMACLASSDALSASLPLYNRRVPYSDRKKWEKKPPIEVVSPAANS
jgi:hypothetical protein